MKWLKPIAYFLGALAFASVIAYFRKFHYGWAPDQETWGQFGDYIGGILNPILSAITFIGVIYTIVISKDQETSSRFFQLIGLYNEKKSQIGVVNGHDRYVGNDAFKIFLDFLKIAHIEACKRYYIIKIKSRPTEMNQIEAEIIFRHHINKDTTADINVEKTVEFIVSANPEERDKLIFEAMQNSGARKLTELAMIQYIQLENIDTKLNHWQAVYDDVYNIYGTDLGHYFRNLYHISQNIESISSLKIDEYSKLFRAQFSRLEIAMLYFNLLSKYSSSRFLYLVLKRNYLKGLYHPDICMFRNEFQIITPEETTLLILEMEKRYKLEEKK